MSEAMDEPRKLFDMKLGGLVLLVRHARGEGWGWYEGQTVPTAFGVFWYRGQDGRGLALIVGQVKLGVILMYPKRLPPPVADRVVGFGWPL